MVPDLIVDGTTGYGFPMGNVKALSAAVQQLIADKGNGHDFESAVRDHIDNYSIEAAAEGITTAVHAVVRS